MFPSHRNYNGNNDPVQTDPSIYMTFFNDIMPNSKQEDASFPFLHFQFDDHDDFPHELFQQQPLRADNSSTVSEILVNMVDSSNHEVNGLTNEYCSHNKIPNISTEQISIRQRSAKKDRHSKINTAKGLRDRRMRLSLDVARQFFSLQDMLGYDKASKTVEWLLIQAKHEIKKLERARLPEMINYSYSVGAKSASSTSECEVVSGTQKATIRGRSINSKGKTSTKGSKIRESRKFILRPLTRDMRDKARARARERTTKKKIMCGRDIHEPKNNDSNQLRSWSSFENCDESRTRSPYRNLALKEVVAEVEEPSAHNQCELLGSHEHVADDSLVITGKWSPSSIFNYPHNIGSPQEHPFADFQFFGKP